MQSIFTVLPTRWRQKPAGIDTERNRATVTLCHAVVDRIITDNFGGPGRVVVPM